MSDTPKRTPKELSLQVDVAGRVRTSAERNSLQFSFGRRFSERLWMLADVYGRPRMAPRVGFESGRKLLNAHAAQCVEELNTPVRTPRFRGLSFRR